ncbi:MAG: NAD(P)-dependent oxidoreductase [bacterium]|nr:NAD(P)-dependent oxidoreductase [bacterium]
MKVLITGANGFLGGHLVEQAIQLGHQVFAAHRQNADVQFISGLNCSLITVNYRDQSKLTESLTELKENQGEFDLVVHNAAVTNTIDSTLFFTVNTGITELLINSIKESGILGEKGKFTLISSLAAMGPVGFDGPVSAYGSSKLKAEKVVKDSGLSYMIFRPTAIYGPRDFSFLPLFKVVKMGLYPMINPKDQKITMIHGADAAVNVIKLSEQHVNQTIPLEDSSVYTHGDMKAAIESTINKKSISFRLPFFVARFAMGIITIFAKIFRFTPTLTSEKHFEISRSWDHDFSEERKSIPLEIKYDLKAGFEDTLNYYRSNKLI